MIGWEERRRKKGSVGFVGIGRKLGNEGKIMKGLDGREGMRVRKLGLKKNVWLELW